jgi:hypothetical protein
VISTAEIYIQIIIIIMMMMMIIITIIIIIIAVAQWLGHYVTSRNVAGSRPDSVNIFLLIYPILAAALDPGVYSVSNRTEYQKQKNNISVQ